ncbi:MAG: sensor histidine kinase [Leptospira sp.]|nr:sensor histidine kinase [Leptospira sp.]
MLGNAENYISKIISNLSPLCSLDKDLKLRFANSSFYQEFNIHPESVGKPILSFLPIKTDTKNQIELIFGKYRNSGIQNQEFSVGKKTYGYSLIPAEGETILILRDISDKKILEKKIQTLHRRLLNIQDKERESIAQDLHDSVGQTILAAKLHIESGSQEKGLELIDLASQELREIYSSIYPSHLKELGLIPAIKNLIKHFLNSFQVSFQSKLPENLSHSLGLIIYRLIQEGTTNIVKHSQAHNVFISLEQINDIIEIKIEDDGLGFDNNEVHIFSSGFGLENMKRRVEDLEGEFQIESHLHQGTKILITLPGKEKK